MFAQCSFRAVAVRAAAGVVLLAGAALPAFADEGMWLMNAPPVRELKKTWKFEPGAGWYEHVQRSAVKFPGGSGALVSSNGLVMTNHHVGSDTIAKLSTPQNDLLRDGFYARTQDAEIKCPDLELSILWTIEDVTERVNKAAKSSTNDADAGTARRKAMSEIEAESEKETGLHSEVVTLFQGGRYHLYRYRRYTDIRLVFAPEQQIAFFGGDTDNFEYPRFNLDCCFFRIYEDGKPLKPEHFFKWSTVGAKENDLGLVLGHPGRTRRLFTVDHLKFMRDTEVPATLRRLWRREMQLQTFSGRSDEFALMAKDDLFGAANSRKRSTYQLAGLLNPEVMKRKAEAEAKIKATLISPTSTSGYGAAWETVSRAQDEFRGFFRRWQVLANNNVWNGSDLFGYAQHCVRMADELPKASADRLREYRDSNLDKLKIQLFSPSPIHDPLEIDRLASGLSMLCETLGADDPTVARALAGKSPMARAAELVNGTTLKDVASRKLLVEGGAKALAESSDPLIRMLRELDSEARALRKRYEDTVESVNREAYAKIAAAWFAQMGDDLYPDATGSLRLAFGRVKGYDDPTPLKDGGEGAVPTFTTLKGLYERAEDRKFVPPFDLPERWVKGREKLKLDTPFNFVLNADIIGGNSGSPVVNRAGEVIGLIFDSNLHALVNDVIYPGGNGRALAVDARAMIEAFRALYDAGALADELTGK